MDTDEKTWRTVLRDIDSAELHFSQAFPLFETLKSLPDPENTYDGYIIEMAFQHAMQAGYTSVESAIKRILRIAGESLPSGPSAHKELLLDSFEHYDNRPPIFTNPDVRRNLHILRGFRHVAAHSYDDFDPDLAQSAAMAAKKMSETLKSQVLEFIEKFDPALDRNKMSDALLPRKIRFKG